MRQNNVLMRSVAATLLLTMTSMVASLFYVPPAYADFGSAAADGSAFGKSMRGSTPPSSTGSNGETTVSFTDENGDTQTRTMSAEELFGGPASSSDWQSLSDMEGDDGAIAGQSASYRSNVDSEDSNTAEAYRTYDSSSDRAHPDFNNEPIVNHSYRVFEQTNSRDVQCGDNTKGEPKIEACHRSNMVRSCTAKREITTRQFSETFLIYEWDGCFDHNQTRFKVVLDQDLERELKGYYVDTQTNTRYDMDADKRFTTAPDHLFRYGGDGLASREYHYLRIDDSARYGVTREDINQQVPEIEFQWWSTRGSHEDITAAARVFINPISLEEFRDNPDDEVIIEDLQFTTNFTRDMTAPNGHVQVVEQATEENGWKITLDMQDYDNGRHPACPVIPLNPGNPNAYPGHNGTAWARIKVYANIVGTVISERIIEGPEGCVDDSPPSCNPVFECIDNTPREYSSHSEAELRPYMSSMFPGDDPQNTSQPVCYQMATRYACAANDYGYDSSKSCRDQQSRPECGFLSSECAAYTEEGECAYYEDRYDCGHNPNYDASCEVRQDIVDSYPGCSKTTSSETTTETHRLEEPRSCEILYDLTSCRKVRTFTPDGDPTTADPYSDSSFPAPGEEDNNPCVEEPDGFVKQADWSCNSRVAPVEDGSGNPQPSPYDPLYPGDDGYCQDATVTYDTTYYYGQMDCYEDAYGDTQCPQGNADNVDKNTCDELDAQGCSAVSSRCVDGARASNGFCYVEEYNYDCGRDVEVEETTYQTEYDCPGDISCMGESCVQQDDENNTSFGEAMAAMNAVQFAAQDGECDELGNCTVFKGEAMECKKALGSYQDCCENPGGPGLKEYLMLLQASGKLRGALSNIEAVQAAGEAVVGAWDAITGPVKQTLSDVTSNFYTSVPENISGEATTAGFGQTLTNSTAEFIGDFFGEAARDAIFSSTTDEATGEAVYQMGGEGAFLGNAMQTMMTAYMYYTLAVLAIQIIWKCEEEEFMLGSKKELRVCHYLGSYCKQKVLGECVEKRESYCCFTSPLARIIQQQARPQLGRDWGDPKNPKCGPMTMEEFGMLDWSQIDLSEWIAMLSEAGLMPPADSEEAARQYSIEERTGRGNYLAEGGDRDNGLERAYDRQPEDPDRVNRNVEEDVWHQE